MAQNDLQKTQLNVNDQCQRLEKVSGHYQAYTQNIDANLLSELKQTARVFRQDTETVQDENRLLRIGVVGQIKRGKSSFLNSLLFNGQEILPKAATPMTAALTKMSYSEEPSATVHFYSETDWKAIEKKAQKVAQEQQDYDQAMVKFQAQSGAQKQGFLDRKSFGQKSRSPRPVRPQTPIFSDEEKSCKELVDMLRASGINACEYAGKKQKITGVSTNEDLVNKLNGYVGANGRFTPLVKSTELKLNVDGLRDIEVVDTPGTNDPVASRNSLTKEFIGQCDVIFLLSYCGQFLDIYDMGLLAQSIPEKGIEEIVLIGSIFDGALLDEYRKYGRIQEALPKLTRKLADQANDNVRNVCRKEASHHHDNEGQQSLMKALQSALPPIFISSRCFDLANKNDNLSEEERHSLNQLNGMYPPFKFTPEILKAVANFTKVDDRLADVRNKKDDILRDRFKGLLIGSKRKITSQLEKIKEDVSQKQKLLTEGDLASLKQQQQAIVKKIETGEMLVKAVFEKHRIQAEKQLRQVLDTIRQDAIAAKQVSSQTGSREESYEVSREVSDSSWYNPFSWGSTRTVYSTRSRTVNYAYANVQESLGKLESFVVETSRSLNEASLNAINLEGFKEQIKGAIKGMFDFSDDSFDPNMVLLPLTNAIDRLTIPSIHLDMDEHINTVREQFDASEVEGDEISRLRNEQARVVGVLLKGIVKELEAYISRMKNKILEEEKCFIPTLTRGMKQSVEQLKKDLENKESTLATYAKILAQVNQDLVAL